MSLKLDFGELTKQHSLLGSANRIQLFTDQIDNPEIMTAIKSEMQNAVRLIFSGFSFQVQNVQILRCETVSGFVEALPLARIYRNRFDQS